MMDAAAWAEAYVQEQILLIRQLCAIPAFSGQEEQRAAFILKWLKEQGAQSAYTDDAGNVCLPFGNVQGENLHVFMAHMDTVFPMGTPLNIREENGRLYAPSVGDDTANVAALMLYARHFLNAPQPVQHPVLIVFNTGEEGLGNLRGVREVCRVFGSKMERLVSFDGTYQRVVNKAVGSERYEITIRAEGGHSYGAFGHSNAIHQAAEVIHALYLIRVPSKLDTKTTYNVGTIEGGTSVNSIAQEARFTCEFRSDDRECLQTMHAIFQGVFEGFRALGWDLQVRLLGERPCMGMVDPQLHAALLEDCAQVIRQTVGETPRMGSSSTDANIPLSLWIPATAFGLYLGGQSHTTEEWIDLSSLTAGLEIGLKLMEKSFGL